MRKILVLPLPKAPQLYFVKQGFGPLQIERVKPLRKPAVNRSEQFASLLRPPLITPETRQAHRCTQLPGFGLLRTCHGERALEIPLGFCRIPLRRLQRDFACNAIDLGLPESFIAGFHRRRRFANPSLRIFALTELCVCQRQVR